MKAKEQQEQRSMPGTGTLVSERWAEEEEPAKKSEKEVRDRKECRTVWYLRNPAKTVLRQMLFEKPCKITEKEPLGMVNKVVSGKVNVRENNHSLQSAEMQVGVRKSCQFK